MNLRIIYIRQILLIVIVIICSQHDIFSQGTDVSRGKQQHFYLGFNICPAQTSIINNGSITISLLNSTKKSSFFGAFEAGYFFSKFFGLSTGVGYSSYISDLTLNTYENNYDTTDSDSGHEVYTRYISGNDITEIQKISFLNIPFVVNLQLPFSNNFGFYLQTGINFSVPIEKNYSSTGTFTYEGYYKAYNIRITDVPYEGFKKDTKNIVEGELKIKSFNPELITSAGAQLTIQNKIQISLGILYNKMLSDISAYSSPGSFRLSSIPNQMRSIMEGSTKTTAQSVGIRVAVRYYLQ